MVGRRKTDEMKNLMNKLTPGKQHKRSGTRENRWLGWSQSLAERHSRVAANHRAMSLTFLHPATTLLFDCGRWLHAAWTITQQINLSIGPILRSLQPAGGYELASRQEMERQRALPSSRFTPNSGAKTIVERWGEPSRIKSAEQIEDLVANLQTVVVKQERHTWLRPLQRVFARAKAVEAGEMATVSRAQHETLLVERSLQIVRRVVDERRRVEEQTRRTLVARQQRSAPQVAPADRETVMQSPRGLQVGAQGMTRTTAPLIDIEQLTDRVVRNIDSRIIAHRERMGTLF